MTMKKFLQKPFIGKLSVVVLILIILLQIIRTVCIFQSGDNYLSDEIYTYGLSNSFYMPFIECNNINDSLSESTNVNEWVSGEVLHNYITVQSSERFRYDSVWYNQSQDRHPPLYYAALHTVCSFFPDQFSFWFGIGINIVCFAVTQVFLFLLLKKTTESPLIGLAGCLWWGFTTAAVDSTLFVRMYGMLMMWTVILLFLHSVIVRCEGKKAAKLMPLLIPVTALGALTQHLFLFAAFAAAVCFCIYYLIKKKFRLFLIYGGCMLGGVLLSWAVFPPAVSQLFTETSSGNPDFFLTQIGLSINYILSFLTGVTLTGIIYGLFKLMIIAIALLIFSVPVLFLFRDKAPVRRLFSFFRHFPSEMKKLLKRYGKGLFCRFKEVSVILIAMTAASALVIFVDSYKLLYLVDNYIIRYLMIICPLIAAATVMILYVLCHGRYGKIAVSVLTAAIAVTALINSVSLFSITRGGDIKDMRELSEGKHCAVIVADQAYIPMFCVMPEPLEKADSFFLTWLEESKEQMDNIAKTDDDKPVLLLVSSTWNEEDESGRMVIKKGGGSDDVFMYEDEYLGMFAKAFRTDNIKYLGRYEAINGRYNVYLTDRTGG